MKVRQEANQWSLLDLKKSVENRGSAAFLSTRVTTLDPEKFATSNADAQFKIKGHSRNNMAAPRGSHDNVSILSKS